MINSSIYRDVKKWKKPIHISKSIAAKAYLKALRNIDIIAITGSVGKTLTQNAIAAVLSQKYKVAAGDENLDPTFRIPQTIAKMAPWTQKVVLEYGIEHPGDMDHYLNIAKPKISVITHVAPTHLKYFGSVHGVFDEKSKLISALPKNGFAVLNADDPLVAKMANLSVAKILWFGKKAQDGIKISHYSQSPKGSKFRLHYQGQKATVTWKVIGEHQLTSAYAAATVGAASGLTLKQIAKGLSLVKPPIHRLNVTAGTKFTILDDTYNSSPLAVQESLKTLTALGKNKPKIAILGEMRDQGDHSQPVHIKIGQIIGKSNVSALFTIGEVAKTISDSAKKNGFKGTIRNFQNTKIAIPYIKKSLKKNSMVLVKGSRHEHLERVVDGLQGKSTSLTCYHCGQIS